MGNFEISGSNDLFRHEKIRDEKRNLRFPCIQWKRKRNFVFVSTVYKGNANFVSRPWKKLLPGA